MAEEDKTIKKEEEQQQQSLTNGDLSAEQEEIARKRAEEGVCVVCGQPRWYCGGEYAHKRKRDLGQE